MKCLLTFLSLFLAISCISQKHTSAKIIDSNAQQNNTLSILDVRYEARTRGGFKQLYILDNTASYKTNKGDKTISLSLEVKSEIEEAISKIDLEKMKFLKSPTNKRMFDGAMHAVVKIKRDGKEYVSSNFDDGYPPNELKPLIDLLMNIVR